MPPPGKLPDMAAARGRCLRERTERWKEKYRNKYRGKRKFFLINAVLAGGILLGGWYYFLAPNAWAVMVNGRQVAVTADRAEVDRIIQDILAEKMTADSIGLKIADQVSFQRVRISSRAVMDAEGLKEALQQALHITANATVITIDGRPEIVVASDSVADAVLEQYKKDYLPPPGSGEIQEVKFLEEVTYEHRPASPEEILTPEQALARLKGMSGKNMEYVVKQGDSLWSIARAHGLLVDDIKAANPELKGERLDIGQRLRLTVAQPLLEVMVVYNQEVRETVPYDVKIKENEELFRGQERVIQSGAEGERLVTYRIVTKNGNQVEKNVIGEQVLKEPVTQVVERGTRMVLASRGGSGILSWPVRGPITSPFGYRGGEFHTGMDIGGNIGQPVGAAADGRVTFAGYDGGYGRMVIIDHGGGLVTRYAHLSGFNVRVGQRVSRGQVIGYVGTSGRTTGPHLHFEVLVNGNFRNPAGYL
ncbi:peptidoglycan DD-metalloendopeptidase family protein [Neomoorella humiferrea]|uniref:Murein DD-endopeptidase MepM n=1 Tax=Neomoorella humiferrea TaxID=676965 RepID=A0A2T0ALD9_9FIRM|nr:peptidoglycan DD-metalloendopeptidase family protein [Moorella humiferrea]PRR69293.1 Murein DD-endopeptidase MepM [Moorella humiferrea]